MNVVLVDSGGANIGSVLYALERLGARAQLSAEVEVITAADRVILPGVGTAAAAMRRLRALGLIEPIRALHQPLLGICLGMQLLFETSDEGAVECLGLIPGRVQKLRPVEPSALGCAEPSRPMQAGQARRHHNAARVPHIGWNRLQRTRDDALLSGIGEDACAYFVHSYAAPLGADTLAGCDHGGVFAAVVGRGNRYGVQFHPERSAGVGARLLENFLRIPQA